MTNQGRRTNVSAESLLRDLEKRIATNPDADNLRLERAGLLAEMGRALEARDAYLEILAREPSHRLR